MSKILIDTGPSDAGWHGLETILRCPFLYAYHSILGGDGDRGPLVRGTLGHIGLAHYYARLGSQQHGQDPERFYEPSEAIDLKCNIESGLYNEYRDQMKNLVTLYARQYLHERLIVKEIEVPVEMVIGGHRITQRFDLVCTDSSGKVYVYDHKVVAKIDSRTVDRYTLSGQFLEMAWQGQNRYGADFGGLRINLLQADGHKFVRVSPGTAPEALTRFPATVAEAYERKKRYAHLDPMDYPRVFSEQTCMTAYGKCDAFEMCRWGRSSNGVAQGF